MATQLVTVATFSTPAEAQLAKNYLESEGMQAFVADEESVAMAWYLGNAYGGVKLQVFEDDARHACEVLEHHTAELDPVPGEPEGGALGQAETSEGSLALEPEPIEVSEGEELATRAFRAAVLGPFLCPPTFSLLSIFVLAKLAFWQGDLSASGTRKAVAAIVLDGAGIVFAIGMFSWFFGLP